MKFGWHHNLVASLSGLITGAAAGLVGVGGGEFRLPVLVRVVKFPLKIAAGANLFIGLATVTVSLWRRWGQRAIIWDELALACLMVLASLLGSMTGSLLRKRLAFRTLKWAVSVYLILIGSWMAYEAVTKTEHLLINPTDAVRLALASGIAFVIAVLSGVFGVAGGEMRIPALIYLFGIPIKPAGTLSLLVSIPTVAGAAITDRRIGHLPNSAMLPALVMGGTSILGVMIGAEFVSAIDATTLKGILGIILILATVR